MANTHIIVGNGPHKVIALHGWLGHADGWGPFPRYLDGNTYSYAFMDCRGYGRMCGKGGPYTMQQVADDAIALADELGWTRFSVIGHSMSGVAIQLVWLAGPDRVRALVGITPVSAAGVPFDDNGWQLFSVAGDSVDARRKVIEITTGHRLTDTWLDMMAADTRTNADDEAVAAYLPSWSGADFADRLAAPQPPVLILAGEHDPSLSESVCRATWLQHYPDAQLQVISNAGHYPMNETPIILATHIEAFLGKLNS